MHCTTNLWCAVLYFNHSVGFMMFLLTIWSTRTQFMKRCYGFCFNWSVFYVILREMHCTPNLWSAVLDFNQSRGFTMFQLTIWSTHTKLMKRCYVFCFNWIVFNLILRQMHCIPNLWIAVLDFNHSGGFMMFLLTIWSTHTQLMKRCFGFCLNWNVFCNFKVKCTAHPTYETLFCILLELEYLTCNFIPNALRTLLMMCCFDFNHSWGFMMFLQTIWSTRTQLMERCSGFCFNWIVSYIILR